ncbi:Uu.00g087230.m01.CDS01 [Anthostomella pinea]|uniref:Uu.00g087230.m01.CDS01 n=1 Tax=Anthostomella pinea TaxID=933095 RepID=A0AAI8VMX3_9PEZI|nr:Uu.00g087230.m01.CDS01 [Anthostomella pinea]
MKTSTFFALLSAAAGALAIPNVVEARQKSTTTTTPDLPCPTNPANCAAKQNGHLVCLSNGVWCQYVDSTYGTPAFFPVDLTLPCPACLPSS